MLRRRTYLRSATTLTATALVAGCTGAGDDTDDAGDDAGDGGAATSSPAGATAGGPTARSEYPDYSWDQLADASASAVTTVDVGSFAFDPLVARVPAGEAVSFPNADSAAHTVTAPALGLDREIQGGDEASITVAEPGTYDYVCRFHPPDMLGRLVVGDGGSDAGDGTGTDDDGDDGGGGGGGGPGGPY